MKPATAWVVFCLVGWTCVMTAYTDASRLEPAQQPGVGHADEASDQPEDAAESARGTRYCDLTIVTRDWLTVTAEVWTTRGVSACPEDCEAAFDTGKIKSDANAMRVVVNGPRVWLPTSPLRSLASGDRRRFGSIEMGRVAAIKVKKGQSTAPYSPRTIEQESSTTFAKGCRVHELITKDGEVFVMMSFSKAQDPSLSVETVLTLEQRLKLPKGWRFQTRILDADLTVRSRKSEAVFLNDELKNTYQRR